MLRTKSPLFIFTLLTFWILFTTSAFAGFSKNLWPIWEANNPLSKAVIDHQKWQTFLDNAVKINDEEINLVDYVHLSDQNRSLLKQYLTELSTIDIKTYNRDEQLAFWINLYNALTVSIIAEHYPVNSIEEINISPGLFSIGPWGAKVITIKGTSLSLDEIQNRIIRPVWNDPRTHYAINNASIGAANLSKQAYRGKYIQQQLNDAAANYINALRGVQVIEGKLIVSKIYEWYSDDFGGNKQDIISHIRYYSREPLRSQLKHINTIESYVYNWHLNSTIADTP